jgi:asparagine synthase (glutamine-hydrolysing)
MCRLAGIINLQHKPTEATIVAMRDTMQHGGPDSAGIYIDESANIALGHRRLSFLDLSPLGHQPMMDDTGNIVLIFNGEIYNFLPIREELVQLGYQFKSTSDTEVIIYAYKQWGIKSFSRFNGMFAFALLDKQKQQLVLVRDYAGIKPLYFSASSTTFYFASEVKAFKNINPNWPENADWKKYFLMFGHLPEPITTLQNVQPLPKGTCMVIDLQTLQIVQQEKLYQQYYNYTINTEVEAVQQVKEKLTKAVERHLISDAPIGLFLSGGLDSSLLTLIAKPFVGNNLHTLSIIFDNEKYSEKYYQDIIIQKTNANHKSYLVTEQLFLENLNDIIDAMDQPSNDGINSYFICKYAKEYGLKAVLSGLGADELFGGYQSFYRSNTVNKIKWLPNFMFAMAGIFPDDKRKKLSFLQEKGGLGEYLFNRGFFLPNQVAQLLDCTQNEVDAVLAKMALPPFTEKLVPQEKISYVETNLYMQNQLLKDTDYMSMWHSIEVRVPFLDKEIIDLAYAINPDIKYNSSQPKHLLVKAFMNELPKEIWQRPKQGFVFPFDTWMQHLQPSATSSNTIKNLYKSLQKGNTHWSRYWCYWLAKEEVFR